MAGMKIGILREDKQPVDRRVVLTPDQACEVSNRDQLSVVAQTSTVRTYSDAEYKKQGIPVVEDVSDCDILLGVKEVPPENLIAEKTYFFFSHTIKAQPYNRGLLQEVLKRKVRLIDWECLTNTKNQRLIAFGRYAGIVGAYNGILTYGKKTNRFQLRPAHSCHDFDDLKTEFAKVDLPPIKIVITGGGRVAKGAMEVLNGMGIERVHPDEYLSKNYDHPVYTQLEVRHYNRKKNGDLFNRRDFYEHPEEYESDFRKFTQTSHLLIAAAYWDPDSPVLFTREDAQHKDFKINVIADITMDIEGSIPSTIRPSTIDDPNYDYDAKTGEEKPAFSDPSHITMMAVDNLPCELPRNASHDFGNDFISKILDPLLGNDPDGIIERATIARDGQLTAMYSYLQGFVDEK